MRWDGAIQVACFSAGLFVWALIERRKYRRIRRATATAQGTICTSQCVTKNLPLGVSVLGLAVDHFAHGPRAFAEVCYLYSAAGRCWTGFWRREVSNEEQAREICSRYRLGDQVEVYFDPDRPEISFFEPPRSPIYMHLAARLCCLSVVGALAMAWWAWTHP